MSLSLSFSLSLVLLVFVFTFHYSSQYRRGSRGGKMGEFPPPPPIPFFFWTPFFLFFFSYPSNIEIIFDFSDFSDWMCISDGWFYQSIYSFWAHCPACNPKTARFHDLATLRCRRPGQVCVYSAIPTACDFDFQILFITLSFCSSIHDAALDSWLFYKETVSKIVDWFKFIIFQQFQFNVIFRVTEENISTKFWSNTKKKAISANLYQKCSVRF